MQDIVKDKKIQAQHLIYIVSFLLSAIPALFLTAPFVEDSLGTMAAAAYLAGSDFSEFLIEKGFYYKYGQSLFYLPVFVLIHNPALRYKALLIINSAVMSFIPLIIYKISISHLRIQKSDAICISLISGCMPSALLYAKLTWAEPMLFLIPWIIIYITLNLYDTDENIKSLYRKLNNDNKSHKNLHLYRPYSLDDLKSKETLDIPVSTMLSHNDLIREKSRLSILLAFVSVLAFMSHQRGIVVVIAVFLFLLLTRIIYKTHLVSPISYSISLIISLLADRYLDYWLKNTVYHGAALQHNLLSAFLRPEIYQKLLSAQGLKVIIRTFFGWLFNSVTSGMGFPLLGMLLCISCAFAITKSKSYFSVKFKLIALLASLLYVGAFLLGMLFFFEGGYDYWSGAFVERCDHLVFGRYLESSLPVMMFLGLYGITRLSQPGNVVDLREKAIKKCAIKAAIIQCLLLIYFSLRISPAMENVDSYVHSIMSMNLCFDMTGVTVTKDLITNLPAALIIAGIAALIVYIVSSFLLNGKNNRLAYLIIGVVFIYIYLRSFIDILYRIDKYAMTDFARYYLGR